MKELGNHGRIILMGGGIAQWKSRGIIIPGSEVRTLVPPLFLFLLCFLCLSLSAYRGFASSTLRSLKDVQLSSSDGIWEISAPKATLDEKGDYVFSDGIVVKVKKVLGKDVTMILSGSKGIYVPSAQKLKLIGAVHVRAIKRTSNSMMVMMEGKLYDFELYISSLKGIGRKFRVKYYYDIFSGNPVKEILFGELIVFRFKDHKLSLIKYCSTTFEHT